MKTIRLRSAHGIDDIEGLGIAAAFSVRVTRRSKLWAKVIVFEKQKDLRLFWRKNLLRSDPGPCGGAASDLGAHRTHIPTGRVDAFVVDPEYFAVIGLIKGRLSPEVVVHECVHAAFYYSRRVRGSRWPGGAVDEERICYPAGILFKFINRTLHDIGLWGR